MRVSGEMNVQSITTFRGRREGLSWARLAALTGGLALAGCSMPIPGFIDASPTGSVKSATYPFAQEDWAKAEPAVIAAIRADAGDDPARWSNADSGRAGLIVGVGGRFAKGGATCRAFVARIADNGDSRAVEGDACEKAGDVTLSNAAPFKGV
jgi:surface antigen